MPFYYNIYLKFIFIAWQSGIVDTFTLVNVFYNGLAQYGTCVFSSLSGNATHIGPKVFFTPISGVSVSIRYILSAPSVAEQRARLASLAALSAVSASSLTSGTLEVNAAAGGFSGR